MTRVLIVDDSPSQLEVLSFILANKGFIISTAQDGREALTQLGNDPVDLVISDVYMPVMDGFTFCEALKADPLLCTIPCLLLTSADKIEDILHGLEASADGYITKPFEEEVLLATIARILGKPASPAVTDTHERTPLRIKLNGHGHNITASREQIINYFLTSYEGSIIQNRMLQDSQEKITSLITQLSHNIDSLSASEESFRGVVNNITDGIITIDQEGVIKSVNPAIHKLFGYEENELIGNNVGLLTTEPHRSHHNDYLTNYARTGKARIIGTGREVIAQKKNGHAFPIQIQVAELTIKNKQVFLGVIRDLTEYKEIERVKSEFISTVSHELRTPLTSIRASLGMMLTGTLGEIPSKAMRMTTIAEQNTERLIDLVNDILDLEKMQSGKMEFHFTALTLSDVIQQALEANQSLADKYAIRFEFKDSHNPSEILGDSNRLIQVIANFFSNAAKFSPIDGVIKITIHSHPDLVRLSVTDQGPGIPLDFRQHVFERFQQADSSDSRQNGGTGLGLNISREIIQRHDGKIGFHSEVGKGATFYFDLPLGP